MKYLLCLIFTFFEFTFLSAQQSRIDSLENVLKNPSLTELIRSKTLNQLSRQYVLLSNYDKAINCAEDALSLALVITSIEGNSEISTAYNNIGNAFTNQGNYPEALKNYLKALENDENLLPDTNNYLPNSEIRKIKLGISSSYNNIGVVYWKQENYNEALKNYFAALKIKEEFGDKKGIALGYNNIGIIYYSQGNYSEALKNYSLSLKLFEEIENKKGIAHLLQSIGLIHFEKKEFTNAIENYYASIKIANEINDRVLLLSTYINLANLFTEQKKFNDSRSFLSKSLNLAKEINSIEAIKETYKSMAQLDSATGNFKSAYENHKRYIIFKDSVFNEENTKKTVQSQMQYEFDKKEALAKAEQDKKDALLKQEEKLRKNKEFWIEIACIIIFISLVSIAFVLYRRYKSKQKTSEELTAKNIIIEERNKNITDSINYAKRLQEAILPPLELIQKYLPEIFIYYRPKDIVAGDFYWMEKTDDAIFIAAADCTGHGVPGAMVSVVCNNALNRAVKEFNLRDTGKILDKVTDLVLETFEKSNTDVKDGMDISLLKLNMNDFSNIQYAGANNSIYIIQNRELKEIKADKQPVGKFSNRKPFTHNEIQLQKGDTIYAFTDGFADQFGGPKGKKFKYKQLEEKIFSITDLSMTEQKIFLEKTFSSWKGNLEQIDDITIIGIKI